MIFVGRTVFFVRVHVCLGSECMYVLGLMIKSMIDNHEVIEIFFSESISLYDNVVKCFLEDEH